MWVWNSWGKSHGMYFCLARFFLSSKCFKLVLLSRARMCPEQQKYIQQSKEIWFCNAVLRSVLMHIRTCHSDRLLTLSWPSHWAICRCLWTTRSLRSPKTVFLEVDYKNVHNIYWIFRFLLNYCRYFLYYCYNVEKKRTFATSTRLHPCLGKYVFPSCQMDNVSSCSAAVAFGRSTCWCLEANSEQKNKVAHV